MIVIVKGVKHEVATIAEARALSGVGPAVAPVAGKRVNPWGDESNGKCNRCFGTGVWGNRTKGGACFRCDGSGIAPGYKGKAAETEMQYETAAVRRDEDQRNAMRPIAGDDFHGVLVTPRREAVKAVKQIRKETKRAARK